MFIKYSIFNHEEKNFADLKTPNLEGKRKHLKRRASSIYCG
jgi:hypothetical protein